MKQTCVQCVLQTKKNLDKFDFAVFDWVTFLEALVLYNFLLTSSDQTFADFVIFRYELLPAHQLFSTLITKFKRIQRSKITSTAWKSIMYLSTHIVLHFVFDQAFVNTTLSCLGVAAKSFTIISTCEKEWTIQMIIVRL